MYCLYERQRHSCPGKNLRWHRNDTLSDTSRWAFLAKLAHANTKQLGIYLVSALNYTKTLQVFYKHSNFNHMLRQCLLRNLKRLQKVLFY